MCSGRINQQILRITSLYLIVKSEKNKERNNKQSNQAKNTFALKGNA